MMAPPHATPRAEGPRRLWVGVQGSFTDSLRTPEPGADKPIYVRRADFLNELVELERKHRIWLSHEDDHGAFLLEPDPIPKRILSLEGWISAAHITEAN